MVYNTEEEKNIVRTMAVLFTSAEGIIYPLIYIITSKIFFCKKIDEVTKLSTHLFEDNEKDSDGISMIYYKK